MIKTLYEQFRHWSEKGSVWIISDTHFEDEDCAKMDLFWPAPQTQVDFINQSAHKNYTLIILGDIGNVEWIKKLKAGHKVLLCGNHDAGIENYIDIFNEVYSGPLMIAEKIILSHVPIPGIDWAYNIHGHDHNFHSKNDKYHYNVAANKIGYIPINLGQLIKAGPLNKIESLNRKATNQATERKIKKEN